MTIWYKTVPDASSCKQKMVLIVDKQPDPSHVLSEASASALSGTYFLVSVLRNVANCWKIYRYTLARLHFVNPCAATYLCVDCSFRMLLGSCVAKA